MAVRAGEDVDTARAWTSRTWRLLPPKGLSSLSWSLCLAHTYNHTMEMLRGTALGLDNGTPDTHQPTKSPMGIHVDLRADQRQRTRSRSPRRDYRDRSRSRSRDNYRSRRERSPANGQYESGGGAYSERSRDRPAPNKEQIMNNARENSQQERRVYVGNLSYDVKWHHLKDFMRQGEPRTHSHTNTHMTLTNSSAGEVLFADVLLIPSGMSKVYLCRG